MSWDCWIADAVAEGETFVPGEMQVDLAGPYQPQPIPMPFYQGFGSEHFLISGESPGETLVQSFGNDSGVLEVNLVRVPRSILDGLEALYLRWDEDVGEKPPVLFFNSERTWLCSWAAQPWRPERTVNKPERYAIKFSLRILEEIVEE